MKKIKFVLPLILSLILFASCKKCKDCSCSQVISQTDMPDVTQQVQFNDVCDEELDDMEGTITFTQSVGGISQSVEQSCDCK